MDLPPDWVETRYPDDYWPECDLDDTGPHGGWCWQLFLDDAYVLVDADGGDCAALRDSVFDHNRHLVPEAVFRRLGGRAVGGTNFERIVRVYASPWEALADLRRAAGT